jgi:hypothetical protein
VQAAEVGEGRRKALSRTGLGLQFLTVAQRYAGDGSMNMYDSYAPLAHMHFYAAVFYINCSCALLLWHSGTVRH